MHPLELSVEIFRALLERNGVSAVSFDVFDTVVTRMVAEPVDLFVDLGRILEDEGSIDFPAARFARLRVSAEKKARLAREDNEPTLAEIYDVLGAGLGWTDTRRRHAIDQEIALELKSSRLNPLVAAYIAESRLRGCTVAFTSDMYLPPDAIRKILEHHRVATSTDPVLVSNEYRVSKARGGLFDQLQKVLGLPPGSILHVGDNEQADQNMPRSRGFHTFAVRTSQLGAIEKLHLPFSPELGGIPGKLAAASKFARLTTASQASNLALSEIGAGLLGPLLGCFAIWTFLRAARSGLNRLYFVSRDGQVMREIALAIQKRIAAFQNIDCRYIYGSRIAWHHASLSSFTTRHLRWLLDPHPELNAAILANRLGISTRVLSSCLRNEALDTLVGRPSWNPAEVEAVRAALVRQEGILLTSSDGRRGLARGYFEQEGLLDGTPWGLVELGWSGSMLTSLCEALGRTETMRAFYLCQTHDDPDLPALVSLRSFLIQPGGAHLHFGRHLRLAEMIEALTAADHPTVLGYQREEGRTGPAFKTGTTPMWPAEYLHSLRTGALGFVESIDDDTLQALCTMLADNAASRFLAIELLGVLARYVENPPRDLALPFTRCVFSEDPADEYQRTFARSVTPWEAFRHRRLTNGELWPQGTLVCSSGTSQALMAGGVLHALSHAARRFRRRFFWRI